MSALCLSNLSWPVQCHTTAPTAANASWPRARSLFLQHTMRNRLGTCSGSHDLRWCSGSPAERVRFSGPDDEARAGETKQHFLACGILASWVPVLQKIANYKYTLPLLLCAHLSGQRSQPPNVGIHRKRHCTCEPARWSCDRSHDGGRPNGPASLSLAQPSPR